MQMSTNIPQMNMQMSSNILSYEYANELTTSSLLNMQMILTSRDKSFSFKFDGNPESSQLDRSRVGPVGEKDRAWVQIPVDDAVQMTERQRLENLPHVVTTEKQATDTHEGNKSKCNKGKGNKVIKAEVRRYNKG